MIILKKEFLEQMIAQAIKEYPNEACGILAGKDGRALKVYEMVNSKASPDFYLMDAKEQLKTLKDIRGFGLEMIGIYHSHVASPAYPSIQDVEMAFYPEVSYVIVSLEDKNNPIARSFKIADNKITEEELVIAEE